MVPRFERNFRNLCGENQTLKITSKNRQEIFESIWLFIHRNKWQEYKCTHRFCQIKKQIVFLLKILYKYVHPHIFRPSAVPAGTKDLGAFNNYVDKKGSQYHFWVRNLMNKIFYSFNFFFDLFFCGFIIINLKVLLPTYIRTRLKRFRFKISCL